ncbi:MAG: LuxR C-terminal-related transcriptional regulator [Actinomycetota bacterium]
MKVLVKSILGSDEISDEFVSYLHERTAGIPFAVEEVLRLLQDRRDLVRREGRWARRALGQLEVPAAIRESVLERLRRLDTDPREIVQAVAVLGQAGDEQLLAAVAGMPPARSARALATALEAALLQEQPGGRYGFRHALATDAVYGAIPAPARRRLHRQAAAAIEGRGDPASIAQLARHSKEAAQPRKWVRHASAAAGHAAALGDHAAAAAFLLDALDAPGLPRTVRAQLALDLSVAALRGLVHVEAIAAVATVVEQELSPGTLRGKLLFNLGSLLHQSGDASASRRAITRAVPELRKDPAQQALAMSALASPWVVEGSLTEHLLWLDRAASLAIEETGDDVGRALHANRAAVLLAVGDPRASGYRPSPPGPAASEWDRAEWVRACTNLAVSCSYLGRYRQAERWVQEGSSASKAPGYDRLGGSLRATGLLLRWVAGHWAGLAEDAAALELEAPDVPSATQAAVVLGVSRLAHGEVDEAEERLAVAAERAARCGAIPTLAMACAGLSRIALGRGEPNAARATAMRALETVAAKGIWAWATEVAPVATEALIACGELEAAMEWARRFDEGIEGRDAPAAAAASVHCSAIIAEATQGWSSAAPAFREAQEAWSGLRRPYDAAWAAASRGLGLVESDREAGANALLEALAAFRDLGADWDEARLRKELRRLQISLPYPYRGGRPSYGALLSPRESEVIELAATGAPSTRIAQRLFLSPRTVDHHIERALRKLGLGSRKDLVAAREAAASPTAGTSNIG